MPLTNWEEYFMYGFINTLAAGVPAVFIPTPSAPPVRIDSNSDFRWMKNLYGATSPQIFLTFVDSRLGRQLSLNPIPLTDIASNFVGTPFILSSPYYLLSAGSNFIINASDASGAVNVLRFVMHGAKLREGLAPWEQSRGSRNEPIWKYYRRREDYTYNTGRLTVAATSTQTFTINVENDAPFLIQKLTGQHDGAVGALLVDIRDSTSIENTWSNIPIPFETVFGTGQFPNIMYAFRMVGGGGTPATLRIDIQNLTGVAVNFNIAFHGLKLFSQGG